MQLIHHLGILTISKNTDENAGFLLTNKKGSYCSFFNKPTSRYYGFFYFDSKLMKMYKFIENIEIAGGDKIDFVKNGFYFAERKKGDVIESFMMPKGFNSLVYELSSENEIDVVLDCRESYDNREWGRNYEIFEEENCIIVKFTKKTDYREDSSSGKEEFSLYLAIKNSNGAFEKNDKWVERHYIDDEKRNSPPFRRFVYNALKLKGKKFVFSISKSKSSAIKESEFVFDNIDDLKQREKGHFFSMLKNQNVKNVLANEKISKEIKIAYLNAANSLNNLVVEDRNNFGVFAGLPWFFQFWARDSVISLKALSNVNKNLAEKILLGYLKNMNEDGRLPNLVSEHALESLGSADAIGWLFLRCRHLAENDIENSPDKSISGLLKFHTKDNFDFNESKETWMDTDFGGDDRKGARIELQALRLNMYKLGFELTQNHKYKILENILKNKLRQKFWDGKALADGLDDYTIRPNIFIASYAYPEFLSNAEWEACFENSLKPLWLEWGGLSTIDKKNKLFTDINTGENPKSYHRGDSWFWLNNLAAIQLNKTNDKKFKKYVEKIINASTEDILWKGCIGCASEISSAKELTSQGCFNQAWSNAMYVEMVDEMFK